MKKRLSFSEYWWGVVILIAGILPRWFFAHNFPSQPVSDFQAILDFAGDFSRDVFSSYYAWRSISPGLPLILSALFKIFPGSAPEEIARWSTVLFTSLMPLVPYVIWRGVFPMRARVAAGLLLALWPGQIIFSTVLAQDNWVLLPTIALCALALRILKGTETGRPFWGAMLYFLALFIRQEMLVVLLPAALIVIAGAQNQYRMKNLLLGGLVIVALLAVSIWHRGQSTGRYSLSSSHIGRSMLGSYVPDAGFGWVDSSAYLAAVDPDLLYELDADFESAQSDMVDRAVRELARRPRFHLARMTGASIYALTRGDIDNLYWSLSAPDVLPERQQQSIQPHLTKFLPSLRLHNLLIHALFLGALVFSIREKRLLKLTLPIALTILIKIGIHAPLVITPRYFLVVIALELMLIACVLDEWFHRSCRKSTLLAVVMGGLLTAWVTLHLFPQLSKYVFSNDETHLQHLYRFPMRAIGAERDLSIDCMMDKGWLGLNGSQEATIFFLNQHPRQGETARVTCELTASEPALLTIRLHDPYPAGGAPDSIQQLIFINDIEVFRHDVSDIAWSGWSEITLPVYESATLRIELFAQDPKTGGAWDRDMIPTKFKFEASR